MNDCTRCIGRLTKCVKSHLAMMRKSQVPIAVMLGGEFGCQRVGKLPDGVLVNQLTRIHVLADISERQHPHHR